MPPAPHVYRPSFITEDAGLQNQQLGVSAVCAPPIASLILALRQSSFYNMEPAHANDMLGPLIRELDPADTELQMLLSKFGWCGGGRGFTRIVETKGLQTALQKFQFVKLAPIGNGAYGCVHKVMNRETRELQAIKQVRMGDQGQGLCDATLREISTLQELDHCNIIKLRDVIAGTPSKYCYLVLELLETDLYSYMAVRQELKLKTIKSIMYQVLAGLRHAHGRSIMHRDLKPQNILLGLSPQPPPPPPPPGHCHQQQQQQHQQQQTTEMEAEVETEVEAASCAAPEPSGGASISGCGGVSERVLVKIADFGLARGYLPCNGQDGGAYTDWVVTLFYRAPELLLGCRSYGPAVDIWSAGCVLGELLNRSPLFAASCEIGQLFDVFRKLGTPSAHEWPDLPGFNNFSPEFPRWGRRPVQELVPRLAGDLAGADLLTGLLQYDPRRRLTASQALRHPWFDEVRQQEEAAAEAANAAYAAAAAAAAESGAFGA